MRSSAPSRRDLRRYPVGVLALVVGAVAVSAACGGDDTPAATPDGGSATTGGGSATTGGGSATTGGTTPPPATSASVYGDVHTGAYDRGPVEWAGKIPNACAPYTGAIQSMEGAYLAGLDSKYNGDGSLCDACVLVKTAKGKSAVLRVITSGTATDHENMDISPEAFAALSQGEYPRSMTWQLAKCPDTGKIQYQFQTGAHVDWSSFWVRNARMPITKVEVKSARHAAFTALVRGSDGTLTDGGGFGPGSFTIRVTGMDGSVVTDTFPSFKGGDVLTGGQFQ